MEARVNIRHLRPEQAMLAFPLIREVLAYPTADAWRSLALKLTDRGSRNDISSGIVVAERHGVPRGLFTYELTDGGEPTRHLLVRNFVVMEPVKRKDSARVLFDHMRELAHELACPEINVDLPLVSGWVRNYWDEFTRSEPGIVFRCPN
ncbi:MAG: hypothetical protein HQ511_09905 [Rhodospirillales bacterium]|nr:hypothetical protein [Rhodospirillales bacterium]